MATLAVNPKGCMNKPYWQKLQDPRWQKKRLEIMSRAGFKCEDCGGDDEMLHIHHSFYRKGLEPWEYPNSSLHCLCKVHHEQRAEIEGYLLMVCWSFGIVSMDRLVCAIATIVKKLEGTPDEVIEAVERAACAKADALADKTLRASK